MATLFRAREWSAQNARPSSCLDGILYLQRLFAHFGSETPLILRAPPIDLRRKQRRVDTIAIAQRDVDQRVDERIGEYVRLEPEVAQLGMLRVVIVRFSLDARVGKMIDFHFKTHLSGYCLNGLGQIQDRELLGELIKDAEFAGL